MSKRKPRKQQARRKPARRAPTRRKPVSRAKPPPAIPDVEIRPEIDTDPLQEDGLTIRQRAFVDALIGPAGGNASRAAELAGYRSENNNALRVTASRLLTKSNVQQAIAHAYAKRRLSPEWAKANIADLASASMANFVTLDERGKPQLDFEKAAAAGALGQIKEYEEREMGDGRVVRKVKLFDRLAANELLLKCLGALPATPEDKDGDRRVIIVPPVIVEEKSKPPADDTGDPPGPDEVAS